MSPRTHPARRRGGSIRDIAGEGILLAAGGRAILLQIADPAVARGVAEHSDFASRPLDRLEGTLGYVYAVVFGSPAEVARARRIVGRAHAPVRSDAPAADGSAPAYSAYDPDLQLWVAATIYDSAVTMFEIAFGPLPDEVADRVYRQYAVLGTALQVPEGRWPPDRAAFRAYWEERVAILEPTADARRIARALLRGGDGPMWLRSIMPLAALMTAALLPPRIRAGFGLRWDARLERRATRAISAILVPYRWMPRCVREAPRTVVTRRYARREAG
ncbi:oxygenase MpaB family protein [Clavibacter sp. CT19]|uniref:oxygenase MpaB family protein n=1 Tax=Clavibacter sp. CT19 TaxID=3018990 RepID=UPI0022EA23F2|nr:oxygenase MpaB family protein [Clavibacter sp. CT19]MDA3806062.1 oxygenase MpaB family protein [Clavibacter sp. CT19]